MSEDIRINWRYSWIPNHTVYIWKQVLFVTRAAGEEGVCLCLPPASSSWGFMCFMAFYRAEDKWSQNQDQQSSVYGGRYNMEAFLRAFIFLFYFFSLQLESSLRVNYWWFKFPFVLFSVKLSNWKKGSYEK